MELHHDLLPREPVTSGTFYEHTRVVNLLIVVSIYNEANILSEKLTYLYKYLMTTTYSFQLVLSVDDSGDDSVRIATEFKAQNDHVEVIVHHEKKGRGFAVREAWKKFDAEYFSFIDADLAMGVDIISDSLSFLNNSKYDIVTASRYCSGSKVERPPLRNAVSKIYNRMLRIMFDEKLNDHQCGFKIINVQVKKYVLNKTDINSWFWDTELLVKAIKSGFKIAELPVTWKEIKYNKTSIKRLGKDIGIHGYGILRLLRDVRIKKFASHEMTMENENSHMNHLI